jgi:hypothetical protein
MKDITMPIFLGILRITLSINVAMSADVANELMSGKHFVVSGVSVRIFRFAQNY